MVASGHKQGEGDSINANELKNPTDQKGEKPDNPVFSPSSILALIEAVEKNHTRFGVVLAMYLGLPTLQVIKLTEHFSHIRAENESKMGELLFRSWYNTKKKSVTGRELERYKDVFTALVDLKKPLYAEVFQQRFVEEIAMKSDDFQVVLLQEQSS